MEPDNFDVEHTTIWSFPERGRWATHKGNYRGNFSPYVPRNLILKYSSEGDIVLDQMCGSGTTLVECKLLNRRAIGFDINPSAVQISKKRLDFEGRSKQKVLVGDARKLPLKADSIDLVIAHPPYLNIIKYAPENPDDISSIGSVSDFLDEIKEVAKEAHRVLKPAKYCAILMGDTRRRGAYIPLAYMVMQAFLDSGFRLKEDIIKKQWNCKTTPYWKTNSQKHDFHLIMHEHLFVFKK